MTASAEKLSIHRSMFRLYRPGYRHRLKEITQKFAYSEYDIQVKNLLALVRKLLNSILLIVKLPKRNIFEPRWTFHAQSSPFHADTKSMHDFQAQSES